MSIKLKDTANITATSSSSATSATKLQTARSINGTNFDGTGNITTANWGNARTLTIGNTGKSVNGSGNVSWSLSEIGAAPAGYGLGTTCQDKSNQDCNNILVTGFYMGSNMTNKPSGCTQGWIYLLVMRHNDSWVRQVAYDFGTASQVYTRVKQNGSWTAWVATDTNTWRGVQDNLTSTATDQSLSANQGKVLKGLIDGKAASNHTHSYVPLANGGNITIHADSDSSSTGEYALIKAGHNELKIASSAGGTTVTKGQDKLTFNGNIVYHAGRKPTISEIGAAAASHTHSYLPLSGGTLSGRLTANGKVSAPTTGGSWINGMTLTNATIGISTQQTTSSYHPILAVKTSGNHVANIGGLGDNFGFYGFKSGRTENATDWSFVFNASSGAVTATGKITASGGFSGALSGNATTATTLQTARTINGTSFNGSANITTANWGTARNLTIGNTAKSVNGSGNVAWSLSEIGAAPSSSVGTLSSLKTSAKGNLVAAINEVFQSADSARSSLVSAIGSPLTSTDTLASIATKLQSKKQELGTAAAKVVSGVSSSTNLNTIVSTLNGYKPYVGKAHTVYVDFNGGKTVYIQPQTTNGSTTIKQGSVWMAMIKDVGAKRDYCLCTSASYGFPSQTKDANNAVSFSIDGNGRISLYCKLYSSKTYRIMLCSINPTYSEIDETEDSSYYYVVKTLEEKDEEEGRKDEESNC